METLRIFKHTYPVRRTYRTSGKAIASGYPTAYSVLDRTPLNLEVALYRLFSRLVLYRLFPSIRRVRSRSSRLPRRCCASQRLLSHAKCSERRTRNGDVYPKLVHRTVSDRYLSFCGLRVPWHETRRHRISISDLPSTLPSRTSSRDTGSEQRAEVRSNLADRQCRHISQEGGAG